MTVHKAKGLEFPVVILADLTAKLTGPQGGDRFCDPDRHLCAQRLLWCAPWELLDAAESERKADEEEALRVAYVAATRARDLLVVAAIGEENRQGGWLSPLHDALYPADGHWRAPAMAPGCPKFADATVLNRPPDRQEEVDVKPGLHHPKTGDHTVVWFDPQVLALKVAKAEGVENEQVLTGTREQTEEGLRLYREWQAARTRLIEQAAAPHYRVTLAESAPAAAEAGHIPVEIVTLPAAADRPTGRKFGRIVHDILQHATAPAEVDALAAIWGRRHAATGSDCAAAAQVALEALQYIAGIMPETAERHRELPVMVRLEDGTLVDGRIDFAWCANNQWTVVDYKTDRREKRNRAQVQLYALALERSTNIPARAVVLEV
jgi:ATP-dependent exoDNAse (exonuclease V) beta subunit